VKKIKSFSDAVEETTMDPKIDYDEINKIIKLLEEKNLAEFELEVEGFKIKISRNSHMVFTPLQQPNQSPGQPTLQPQDATNPGAAELQPQSGQAPLHFITSPMVGTFYRAPAPNSPPFIEVGEPVKKKQTVCIVEAMKLMNEIESDVDGVVKEIFIENGKPVEFGKKLFAILPTA
jgi:acetyl-CoA carboxylase biotin carboxyl carrier protein